MKRKLQIRKPFDSVIIAQHDLNMLLSDARTAIVPVDFKERKTAEEMLKIDYNNDDNTTYSTEDYTNTYNAIVEYVLNAKKAKTAEKSEETTVTVETEKPEKSEKKKPLKKTAEKTAEKIEPSKDEKPDTKAETTEKSEKPKKSAAKKSEKKKAEKPTTIIETTEKQSPKKVEYYFPQKFSNAETTFFRIATPSMTIELIEKLAAEKVEVFIAAHWDSVEIVQYQYAKLYDLPEVPEKFPCDFDVYSIVSLLTNKVKRVLTVSIYSEASAYFDEKSFKHSLYADKKARVFKNIPYEFYVTAADFDAAKKVINAYKKS